MSHQRPAMHRGIFRGFGPRRPGSAAAILAALLVLTGSRPHAAEATYTIPSTGDLWLSGQPDGTRITGETGTDSAPAESPFLVEVTAGTTLSFAASGSTSVDGQCFAGPDGGCYPDESGFGSGPANGVGFYKGPATALIGVFLGPGIPTGDAAPQSLDYTEAANRSLPSFAPEIGQVFYIGDGLTGTGGGSIQQFPVPTGATRLFLTVADSLGGAQNNVGSLTVKVTTLSASIVTQTTLRAVPTSAPAGSEISLTALVSPAAGTPVPTGTVKFKNGTATLGTVTLNGTGQATLSTKALAVGTHAITAAYSGSADDRASTSNAVAVTVTPRIATATSLSVDPVAATSGTPIHFVATVRPISGTTIPAGRVAFKSGTTKIGSAALDAAGTAILTSAKLAVGAREITATYAGDAGYLGSSSTAVELTIDPVATTTTLTAAPHAATYGSEVTFTATVKPVTGLTVPAGAVTFKNGTKTLGSVKLNGAAMAVFKTSSLGAGVESITAEYAGDASAKSSSGSVSVTIAAARTTTVLTADPTTAAAGTAILFTATVKPGSGAEIPAGRVQFLSGRSSLGIEALGSAGAAKLSVSDLAAGKHSITAVYLGNANDKTSTSSAITVTVNPPPRQPAAK